MVERSRELETLVNVWFQAASTGDASVIDRHVSRDAAVRLIGSDPNEWLAGAKVADFLRGEVTGSGGKAKFVPSDTEAFSEGTVGWATTHLRITLADGGSITPRWSAVFHKEDGVWKFVQTHASIAVPNAEIGWVYSR